VALLRHTSEQHAVPRHRLARRISLSLPIMAVLAGAGLRIYRAIVLQYGWSDRWLWIAGTFIISGLLLAISGWLFREGLLTSRTQTMAWTVIFFFASAAASSAYLTVSETFPLEIRALAIAAFYAIGTGIGGVAAPFFFGALIETGSRSSVFAGYLFGAALMVFAGLVQARWGVAAERRSLEDVARPLSASGD